MFIVSIQKQPPQNSQESTSARVLKLSEACNFIKEETQVQVLSSEFCEILKSTFFKEHLSATASFNFEVSDKVPSATFILRKNGWCFFLKKTFFELKGRKKDWYLKTSKFLVLKRRGMDYTKHWRRNLLTYSSGRPLNTQGFVLYVLKNQNLKVSQFWKYEMF